MKKFLLFFLASAIFVITQKASGQACNVSNLVFKIDKFAPGNNGSCTYTVDLGFNIAHNNGNKFAFVNLWLTPDYPGFTYGSFPTSAQLISSKAIGTIEIQFGSPDVLVTNTYSPDGGNAKMLSGTLSKTSSGGIDTYTISNVTLSFATCPSSISVTGDVWSSQASHGQTVQCFNTNLSFVPPPSNFNMTGIFFCTDQNGMGNRQYNLQMTSTNTQTLANSVTYKMYVDNGDGIFNPTTDILDTTSGTISVYSGNSYNNGRVSYPPYSYTAPYNSRDLWILATVTNTIGTFNQLVHLTNGCIITPVNFQSFTAARNNSTVLLKWTTASEQNNSGFVIEKQTGNGTWQAVAFVPTQAPGGNSTSALSYTFTDANTSSGITNYRIRQVDIDGRFSYSVTRALKGIGQSAKTIVYPNPSMNGTVNIIFEDRINTRDITLIDMSGRIIKQWNSVTNNNLQVTNLTPGMYGLRVITRETGDMNVDKIVISGRQ
jgi:hypothetical protein